MATPSLRESESENQPAVPGPSHENSPKTKSNKGILKSLTDQYRVIELIGKGSFGIVYKCWAQISKRSVAVKVLRDSRQKDLAEQEFEICLMLSGTDYFVEILDFFEHRGRPCLVFELLEENLLNYIVKQGPLSIKAVRPLIHQLLEALKILKGKNIVHGDLKPVNIMIKRSSSSAVELKIIDLGGAMHISECTNTVNFQTLHFRAPEVIIRAPCSEKVDMWSTGCILAEMLVGRRIYPGKVPKDQIMMITKCQGALPHSLLCTGQNSKTYYNYSAASAFTLKGAERELKPESWSTEIPYYIFHLNSLDDVTEIDESASPEEKQRLLSLLKWMLSINPVWRCTPEEALSHEFFRSEENVAK